MNSAAKLTVIAVLAASLAACKHPKPAHDGSFPPLHISDADNSCKVDSDCAITCRVNGNCCDQTCHCGTAYARGVVDKLHRRWAKYCRGNREHYKCSDIACGGASTRSVARCKKGRCVSVQLPLGPPASQPAK